MTENAMMGDLAALSFDAISKTMEGQPIVHRVLRLDDAQQAIAAAGLVPLTEVRALVRTIIDYVDEEAPIMDINPTWFAQEAWGRFNERFEGKEPDHD